MYKACRLLFISHHNGASQRGCVGSEVLIHSTAPPVRLGPQTRGALLLPVCLRATYPISTTSPMTDYGVILHALCFVLRTLSRYIRRISAIRYSSLPSIVDTSDPPGKHLSVLPVFRQCWFSVVSLFSSQIRRNQNKQPRLPVFFPLAFLLFSFLFSSCCSPLFPLHKRRALKEAFRKMNNANMRAVARFLFFKIVPRARRCACLKLASHPVQALRPFCTRAPHLFLFYARHRLCFLFLFSSCT